MNNTQLSNGHLHRKANLKGILTGICSLSEDTTADRTVKLLPPRSGIDHLLAHTMAVNGFVGTGWLSNGMPFGETQ